MSNPAPSAPTRTPLSMQTEVAKQQQLTTIVMLLLLLGPISLAVAGVLAGMAGRIPRRMAWCALGGTLALAVAGWCWRDYQTVALTLWATGGTTYRALQAGGGSIDYGGIARQIWPPLWAWWRMSLLAAPFAALNILSNRVRTVEELEQERLDRAERSAAERDRQARASVAKAPVSVRGAMVLGVPLGVGDLPWATGALFTYPADSLARHGAIIGSSGMGKSETMLRLAAGARQTYGWKVFVIDCKGERALQERFAATMRVAGATTIGSFPEQPLRGWQGDSVALLNRLLAVLDYSEPYYKDLTKMLLNLTLEAPGGPPRSSQALLEGMVLARLRQRYAGRPEVDEIDGLRARDAAAAYNRYRAFFKALGSGLDGAEDAASWSFDTVDAGYILLDGLSLKDQTASFGRYLIEDFAHYAARRKPTDQRVLLIIDEYPVIAQSGAGTASLFEMVRFHGASIIVTGQSYAGMGEGFDRILGAAETLILHRCGDPDLLLPRAGQRLRFTRRIGFSERGMGRGAREYATGAGYLSLDEALKIHPNDVKELPPGECYVIAGGRAQRVLVKRASVSTTTADPPAAPTRPISPMPPPVIEVERSMRGPDQNQRDRTVSDAVPPAATASPTATTYADEDLG
ncbi:MAG: DUF87 domain-containing protein [Chloroflexales bacterium]